MIRVAHVATIDLTHRFMLLPQLRALRDAGYDVTAISAPGPHVPAIESEGIRHIPLQSATRSWDPVSDARAAAELAILLRRERFHLVHTHNPKPGVIGRPVARSVGIRAVVNTVHGFYATPEDPWKRRVPVMALERIAARFSDLELYQSREDLDWARRSGLVTDERSRLLGNGTDLRRFDPTRVDPDRIAALRAEFGIADGDLVVGTVGRLVAEKGFGELLAAADIVRAAMPHVRFIAVGPADPGKADSVSPAAIAAGSHRVLCTGFRTDVEDLLAMMDVFVLPSWREGMPRSAIEAGAMGTARVLTDIRGCREVVTRDADGLLVPVRDPVSLANAILHLLRDAGLRDQLGRRARESALARFDERRVTERLLEAYEEVLMRKRVTRRRALGAPLAEIQIRSASAVDVPDIVRLHVQDLPTAFHTMLGEGFLRQLFLAQVRDPDGCVAVVAARDGEVVGYASAMVSMRAFRRRFLVRHGVAAAIAAAPRLIRPGVVRRLLETLTYPEQMRDLPEAEMAFIGVQRGIPPGLGTELCRALLDGLAARGVRKAKGFVGRDNRPMNFMVRRLGFVLRGEVTLHDGSPNYVYEVACPSSSLSS